MLECVRGGWIFCGLSLLEQQAPPTMMGCLSSMFAFPLDILLFHPYVLLRQLLQSLIFFTTVNNGTSLAIFFSQEIHYYSRGLRINPNLYECGRVCLSLLNTWTGHENENWLPNKSTMLQVLVSIQALILNEKPFFNEPGYDLTFTGSNGAKKSTEYNEQTFLLSLKTMLYTIRTPPQVWRTIFSVNNDMLLINSCTSFRN